MLPTLSTRPKRGAPKATISAMDRIDNGDMPLLTQRGLVEFEALAMQLAAESGTIDLTDKVAKKKFHRSIMLAYSRLIKSGFQFRKDESGKLLRKALRHLRACAKVIGMQQSQAQFALHANTNFGRELISTVTILPDPALGANFEFGSEPEPKHFIGEAATAWAALKQRRYVDKTGTLQNKCHYVLAHLLNHNVGGSGMDAKNLVPFWAAANTQMEAAAEDTLKTKVNVDGFRASWKVVCGPDMGLTPARQLLFDEILTRNSVTDKKDLKGADLTRYMILWYEQFLPQFLTITLKYFDLDDVESEKGVPSIPNFVPMTIPELV